MSLYQISTDFQQLFNSYDDFIAEAVENGISAEDAEQAWFDTLENMEEDIEEKFRNTAMFIKNVEAEAAAIKTERDRLAQRERVKNNLVARLKQYLLDGMVRTKRQRVEFPECALSVRNNAESVKISDEQAFIEWAKNHNDELLRFKEPEISKTAVKKALQSGQEIPLATLERSQSVIIK